jgi:hypothetical protein
VSLGSASIPVPSGDYSMTIKALNPSLDSIVASSGPIHVHIPGYVVRTLPGGKKIYEFSYRAAASNPQSEFFAVSEIGGGKRTSFSACLERMQNLHKVFRFFGVAFMMVP